MADDYRARPSARLSGGGGSKRKRRIEITRYSSRITLSHDDAGADETAADLALKLSDDAHVALEKVNGKEPVGEGAAEMSRRWHLLRFFAWRKRQR